MELIQMESTRVERYRDARLEVDFQRQAVYLDGAPVHLTRLEFALLADLARTAGKIVPREMLMLRVWGYGPEIHSRTMDVHLRRLRVKLGAYSRQHIETVFGLGYRLQPCSVQMGLTSRAG
jgi:DNA-binding response OmpR family regulator